MPLAFESMSHGAVTFGFFNIDSDLLLLERHFFFAGDFCRLVGEAARCDAEVPFEAVWPVRTIERNEDVGDLMGAIQGVRFTGFIGETYRRYPFPPRPEDFKQKPEGDRTRAEFAEMLRPFSVEEEVTFAIRPEERRVSVGAYRFTRKVFAELVRYVWRGGYPRWRDEERPGYVLEMGAEVERSAHWLFTGLELRLNRPSGGRRPRGTRSR